MESLMDIERLERLANRDKDIEQELFNVFFKEADLSVRIMIKAQVTKDDANWKETALKFKQAADYLGAVHLAGFLETIKDVSGQSGELRSSHIKNLLREIGKLKEFYQQRTK